MSHTEHRIRTGSSSGTGSEKGSDTSFESGSDLGAGQTGPGGAMLPALSYGLLGLPLAMSALPVYVHIPAYYTGQLGSSLFATGLVLFFARMVDTVQDPLLGLLIDRQQRFGAARIRLWMMGAGLLLVLGFACLWLPPVSGSTALLVWLALMLILSYTAHSMLNIAYLSWGARLSGDLLKPAAWREGLGLAGVILASVIPGLIMQNGNPDQIRNGLHMFVIGFALLLALALFALLRFAPPWQTLASSSSGSPAAVLSWRAVLQQALANRAFLQLAGPYFLNALAAAIGATLTLFFIADRLGAAHLSGYFLASYFLAGAAGLPLWVWLARRIGYVRAWRASMLLALAGFSGAALLGPGDIIGYFAICTGSGLALGADLALPPVLLARLIPADQAPANYFGIWTLLGKLALALSGLTLPLLAQFDYQPGQSQGSIALLAAYAGLPWLCKLWAYWALGRFERHASLLAPRLPQEQP